MKSRRVGLAFADQVLSNLSNVLVVFALASVSSVHAFGVFTLAYTGLGALLVIGRGFLGTPLLLLSDASHGVALEARFALAVALSGGVVVTVAGVLVWLWSGALVVALVGFAAPIILGQDIGRFVAMAKGWPSIALASDATWAIGSALMFLLATTQSTSVNPPLILMGFIGSSLCASVVVLHPLRLVPRFSGLGGWLSATKGARLRFGAEGILASANSLVILGIATSAVGISASAALRGANTVMGPVNVLLRGVTVAVVPELRRRDIRSRTATAMWPTLRMLALLLSLASASLGLLSIVTPDSVGRLFLGASWTVVKPILPIVSLEYAALAWLNAIGTGLRTQGRSSDLLRVRIFFVCLAIAFSSAAALLFSSTLAIAVALAAASVLAALRARSLLFRNPIPVDHHAGF